MALAIFDLDETLIAADSCSLFCQYMVDQGHLGSDFVERDRAYMALYAKGELDQKEYIRFFIGEIKHLSVGYIESLMPEFVADYIQPIIYPQAKQVLAEHIEAGRRPLIISATSEFIVKAVSKELNVDDYIAINLEQHHSHFTGEIIGTPSFREGKVTRLLDWLDQQKTSLTQAYFYTDSINDLPLLQRVDRRIIINPDVQLNQTAHQQGWPVLHWRLNNES